MILNMEKKYKIFCALLLVTIPIIYTWTIELYYNTLIYPVIMTNGFFEINGSKMYHILMYLLFCINFICAYIIIRE